MHLCNGKRALLLEDPKPWRCSQAASARQRPGMAAATRGSNAAHAALLRVLPCCTHGGAACAAGLPDLSLEHEQSLVDREVVGLEALNQLKGHLANFSKVGTLGDLHVNR